MEEYIFGLSEAWRNELLWWGKVLSPFVAVLTFILGFIVSGWIQRRKEDQKLRRDAKFVQLAVKELNFDFRSFSRRVRRMSWHYYRFANGKTSFGNPPSIYTAGGMQFINYHLFEALSPSRWNEVMNSKYYRKGPKFIEFSKAIELGKKHDLSIQESLSHMKEQLLKYAVEINKYKDDLVKILLFKTDVKPKAITDEDRKFLRETDKVLKEFASSVGESEWEISVVFDASMKAVEKVQALLKGKLDERMDQYGRILFDLFMNMNASTSNFKKVYSEKSDYFNKVSVQLKKHTLDVLAV